MLVVLDLHFMLVPGTMTLVLSCFFCSCDLDLDPLTFIYEPDLTILKMYPYTKNELSRSRLSKVILLQTDKVTQNIYYDTFVTDKRQ